MMDTQPKRIPADSPYLADILALLRRAFAYMDGRIDPPSSLHHLSVEQIAKQCDSGEVWGVGQPPRACIFFTVKEPALYLGKFAISKELRGQGLARKFIELAERRATALGLSYLELETRIELTENHHAFAALGFVKTGETSHDGYDRVTSILMQKRL